MSEVIGWTFGRNPQKCLNWVDCTVYTRTVVPVDSALRHGNLSVGDNKVMHINIKHLRDTA